MTSRPEISPAGDRPRGPALPVLALAGFAAIALLAAPCPALADEGMWTFDNFPKKAIAAAHGFEPSDAWLEKVRLSSVRLAGGCSGSFVSGDGLVMTNAHCITECVQEHSAGGRDLAVSAFVATRPEEELRCADIEVNQLIRIEDVTAKVVGAGEGKSDRDRNRAQKEEMSRIEKACAADASLRCDVVSLYYGGLYHLYAYRTYRDVRLVFAPENDIAFFGGDPDNFMFPRYDLDMGLLRVWEGGEPARTENHFGWSAAGPAAGDLVFVPGNPGGTDRSLTVAQLEYLRDVAYPRRMLRSAELRGVLRQFVSTGPEAEKLGREALMFVENSLKSGRGEYEALLDPSFLARRAEAESGLRARIAADPVRQKAYGDAWDEIARAQAVKRKHAKTYSLVEGSQGFSSDLFRIARRLVRAADERPLPGDKRLREFRDSALPSLQQSLFSPAPIYPQMEKLTLEFSLLRLREDLGADDPFVKKVLGADAPADLARALVDGSKLADVAVRRALWDGGRAAIDASTDPMIRLARLVDADARAIRRIWEDEVEAVEKRNTERIARALFEVEGTSRYPDATFTPRLTYGTVRGWEENGRTIPPFTDFAGLFERATGRDPFRLPARWTEGRGRLNPSQPFNFVCDTDISGGNSGSPVVDRQGDVVGLAFDGNIHSLGGNFWFDPSLNRTVAVHSGGILEALRGIYGAAALASELTTGRRGAPPAR